MAMPDLMIMTFRILLGLVGIMEKEEIAIAGIFEWACGGFKIC